MTLDVKAAYGCGDKVAAEPCPSYCSLPVTLVRRVAHQPCGGHIFDRCPVRDDPAWQFFTGLPRHQYHPQCSGLCANSSHTPLSRGAFLNSFTCPHRGHLMLNKTASPSASFFVQLLQRKSVFFPFVLIIRSPIMNRPLVAQGLWLIRNLGYGETGDLSGRTVKSLALFF